MAGVIQGLQGWSALVQVRVRQALFDKERGESAVCQGCEEGRETPELSALLDFLESPDHLPSSISLPSEVQRVTVAGTRIIWVLKVSVYFVGSLEKQFSDEVNGGVLVSPVLQVQLKSLCIDIVDPRHWVFENWGQEVLLLVYNVAVLMFIFLSCNI